MSTTAALLERLPAIVAVIAVMFGLDRLDPSGRVRRAVRRQNRRDEREERRRERARVAYCQRRWQRVTTCTIAGQHDAAEHERARLIAARIPDLRPVRR